LFVSIHYGDQKRTVRHNNLHLCEFMTAWWACDAFNLSLERDCLSAAATRQPLSSRLASVMKNGYSRKPLEFIVLFSNIAIVLTVGACDLLHMDYVPTPSELRESKRYAEFIVEETHLQGIYANQDVDSVIFTYKTNIIDEKSFWIQMDKVARDHEWKMLPSEVNIRRYERIMPRTGKTVFYSAEEVRIACQPETMTITVAWVQADESKTINSFTDTYESGFADAVVWPKFNELIIQ